jgi:hypothetical protein
MKKIILMLIMGLISTGLFAQSDIQSMLRQIALLEVYIVDLKKGYDIAQKGLTFIGEIKKGEFDLHSLFFNSLAQVNPSIKKYEKVADIISLQVSIVDNFKNILQVKAMSAKDISYLNRVYQNMLNACRESLQDLIDLTTDNEFKMSDDERVSRIDLLYLDMKDKQAFTQSFTSKVKLLSAARTNEENEINFLNELE